MLDVHPPAPLSDRTWPLVPEVVQPEPPETVAHVPSPLQKCVLSAFVPLLRFVTGRFPVTPAERLTWAHVRSPLAAIVVAYLFAAQSAGFAAKAVAVEAFPESVAVIVEPKIVGVAEVQSPAPSSTRICPDEPAGTQPEPPPPVAHVNW